MKKTICIVCFMAFICLVSFSLSQAQDGKPEAKKEAVVAPTDKEKAEVEKKVDLFYKVVSYGETQKNPLILVSAVSLLDDLSFTQIAKPGVDGKAGFYDRTSLLNQAKQYAAGDTELLEVIAKVENPPEKTAVRGHGGYRGEYYGHHRGYHGHGGRHWGCVWYQRCGHRGCTWVCR